MTDTRIPTWTLADRLRKSRSAVGLEQKDMAERLMVSRGAIAGWETGNHKPSRLALVHWAQETNVPLDWLETGVVTDTLIGRQTRPPARRVTSHGHRRLHLAVA